MKISVFGLGYVGAVSCACFSRLGHNVVGVDVDDEKVRRIAGGESPIVEPGLQELVHEGVTSGNLTATTDPRKAVRDSDVAIVCVGTPSNESGGINGAYLTRVATQIGEVLRDSSQPFFALINRSTALPPLHDEMFATLAESSGRSWGDSIGYACHPEFLREGSAVNDFFNPPKIVYGTSDGRTEKVCQALYPGLDAPTAFMSIPAAAMVKYAANSFHALKVTFANEVGLLCRAFGVDAVSVMDTFCQDTKLNISSKYLRPGAPYGGSCLPKDLAAILDAARVAAVAMPMLSGIQASNDAQVEHLLKRIESHGRVPVGIVGLAFKEGTDDVRQSPMVTVVERLVGKGYPVSIFDPFLSPENLRGANRAFALASIPHLTKLLRPSLQEVFEEASTIVINHRLAGADWSNVGLRNEHHVLDLVGIGELSSASSVEGLYW